MTAALQSDENSRNMNSLLGLLVAHLGDPYYEFSRDFFIEHSFADFQAMMVHFQGEFGRSLFHKIQYGMAAMAG